VQRRSPSADYLPRHLSFFQSRDQWHPSQLVCRTRSSRDCAQRPLLLSSPTTPKTRHRVCLRPRSLRLLSPRPVGRHYHPIRGYYIQKSSRCGGRWSDFAQRDWLLRHHRAIRRGAGSLLVLSSLDTNFWGLCDCYFTSALQFLVGTQDISIIYFNYCNFLALSVGVAFEFVTGGELHCNLHCELHSTVNLPSSLMPPEVCSDRKRTTVVEAPTL
jgi:hypothetical protein